MSAGLKRWKPYPEYKESGVEWLGEVPARWAVWKLSHAFSIIGSGTTPKSDTTLYYDGDMPWVTTTELREGIISETKYTVSNFALAEYSALRVYPKGTLLVAMYGATIGRMGLLGIEATCNQACCALAEGISLLPNFLFFWFQGMRNVLLAFASGGGQPNLSQEFIKSILVAAPIVKEQQAIAAFLDQQCAQIDSLIEKKQRMLDLLDEKRRASITQAVTRGLDPSVPMKDSGVEWLGMVPAGWRISRSTFYFDFVTSGSRAWAQFYADSGSPFVRIGNIMRDSIQPDLSALRYVEAPSGMEAERTAIRTDDIFISITADIGSVGIATSAVEGGYISQHIALCRPNRHYAHSRFLAYAISSTIGKNQLLSFSYGGTKVQLSLTDIKNIHLALPPLPEQQAIADYIDAQCAAMDSQRKSLEKSIELLREYRSSLITHAVTGKIDVRELAPLQ